jgi:VanZ family protein
VIIVATLIGASLCTGLEYFQTYLPNRVPSLVDILLNTAGTMFGASLALLVGKNTPFYNRIIQYKSEWFVDQPLTNLAIIVAGFWAISQLTPLVPSPDFDNLKQGLKPLWHFILDTSTFNTRSFAQYAINLLALSLLISVFIKPNLPIVRKLSLFYLVVLVSKVPIIGRQLSFEALLGAVVALVLFTFMNYLGSRTKAFVSIILSVTVYGYLGMTNSIDGSQLFTPMNWIPFMPQMSNIFGIVDLTFSIWPFIALACLLLVVKPNAGAYTGIIGGITVFAFAFYIEWYQQSVPGRYADITDAIMATLAFSISYWRYRAFRYKQPTYNYTPVGKLIE